MQLRRGPRAGSARFGRAGVGRSALAAAGGTRRRAVQRCTRMCSSHVAVRRPISSIQAGCLAPPAAQHTTPVVSTEPSERDCDHDRPVAVAERKRGTGKRGNPQEHEAVRHPVNSASAAAWSPAAREGGSGIARSSPSRARCAGPQVDQAGCRVVEAVLDASCAAASWWAARAVSSSARHEVTFGRRHSRARRSHSVIPPRTPHSIWSSSASARHSVRTEQPGLLPGSVTPMHASHLTAAFAQVMRTQMSS
jgi:hypothetical protein